MRRFAIVALIMSSLGCGGRPPRPPPPSTAYDTVVVWPTLVEGVRATRIFPGAVPCIEDERGAVTCVHTPHERSRYVVTLGMFTTAHGDAQWERPPETPGEAALSRSPWTLALGPFDAPAWSPPDATLVETRVDGGCAVLADGVTVLCRVLMDNVGLPRTQAAVRVAFGERIVEVAPSSEPGPWMTDCYGATWPQGHHYCARLEGGRVACWGENGVGQRGDGTRRWPSQRERRPRDEPGLVAGIDDAVQIALGMHHSCALHRTGRVSCWGYNHRGQLGDGTRETRLSPVRVLAVDDVISVRAADEHTCALRRDGRVLCWGAPSAFGAPGRVPEEGVFARYLPLPERAIEVVAANDYTCARSRAGRVYCGGWL